MRSVMWCAFGTWQTTLKKLLPSVLLPRLDYVFKRRPTFRQFVHHFIRIFRTHVRANGTFFTVDHFYGLQRGYTLNVINRFRHLDTQIEENSILWTKVVWAHSPVLRFSFREWNRIEKKKKWNKNSYRQRPWASQMLWRNARRRNQFSHSVKPFRRHLYVSRTPLA